MYNNNPSYYYGSANVSRSVDSTEEDAFLKSNVSNFRNNNVEARNYCVNFENEPSGEKDNVFNVIKNQLKILKKH